MVWDGEGFWLSAFYYGGNGGLGITFFVILVVVLVVGDMGLEGMDHLFRILAHQLSIH